MAIIPRAPLQVRDVGSLPQVRNTTRVEAATGMAAAVGSVVAAGADLAQERADRADTAAVMDGQQQLSTWQNDWFDPNNEKGVRKYQGVNALKLSDTMVSDFQRRASEIEARMPSTRAREKFREYAGVELQQVRGRINSYAVQETDAAEAAMRSAFEDARRNDMIGALVEGDEQRAATTWATTVDLIHANAAAGGRPAEETQLRIAKLQSDVHVGALDIMLSRNPQQAEAYFRRNVDKILPSQQASVERALRPLLLDATAEQGMRAIVYGGDLPDAALGFEGPSDGKAPPQVPPAVRQVIEAAAAKHGVPLPIALALAEQESGFDPKAVGRPTQWGKAGGLYQFLESTAKAKGIDRFNPQQAANAAMEDLAREGRGRGWDWAIAHHFAGPDEDLHGPKTRAYVEEVRAKARRYAGGQGGARVAPAADKAEALAIARRIADPQLRSAVEARVRDELDILDARQKAAEQQTADDIYQKVAGADPRAPLRQLLTSGEVAFVGRNSSLSEAISRFRKLMATGQVVEDDPVVVDRLARLQADDPNAFRAVRLAEYADRLSGQTLLRLTKEQKDKSGKLPDWASGDERVRSGWWMLGYQPTGKKDEAKRGQFRLLYDQTVRAFVQKQRRDPSPGEADTMLRGLVRRVAERPRLLEQAETAEKFGAGLSVNGAQLSDADRAEIVADFKAVHGRAPTDAEIVRIGGDYQAKGQPVNVPQSEADLIRAAYAARGLPPPNAAAMLELYRRRLGTR